MQIPQGEDAFRVLESSPASLPMGIYRLLIRGIAQRHVDPEVGQLRARLVEEQPEAHHLLLSTLLQSGYALASAATEWLETHPEHATLDDPKHEGILAATLVHGIVTAKMGCWVTQSENVTAQDAVLEGILADYQRLLPGPR